FVRGDATEGSDVDILVEFEEVPSFFKFIEIENYLSNILGIKVDLVEKKKSLKPRIGEHILKEVIIL
ncbi:MAG: nucleotidyltransferase, partial [Thermodesulfobacteriota bacterium]